MATKIVPGSWLWCFLQISRLSFLTMVSCFVLICTPSAITRYLGPVHRLRCFLLAKLYYYWQLSLEGPLFKLIGYCGRSLGKGTLASKCKAPKAFKAKVNSTTEMEMAWTPQLPDNPFHEEHYIFSWCQVPKDGEEADWEEKPLNKDDYTKTLNKEGKEKPKEIGKAQRLRYTLSDLPPQTSYRLRLCAVGPAGRSPWSPEVLASTFAKPDKNSGLSGPLLPSSPTTVREYQWWQSKHEVGLWVAIPEEWKGRDFNVKVTPNRISIVHDQGKMLDGPLGRSVRADEVDWIIDKAADGGKQLSITLRKEKLMELWASFIDAEGHPRIDTALLQLFHEGNSMNELATADLWE